MSRYQALIWEQNRVAVPAAGMCLLMGMMVLGVFRLVFGMDHADNLPVTIYLFAALGTGAVLLLRNDPEGHLVTAFERRLARLPLKTPALVAAPLLIRLFYLALTCALLGLAYWGLFGSALSLNLLLLPITVFLLLQAYVWARHVVTGLEYILPLALLLAPIVVAMLGLAVDFYYVVTHVFGLQAAQVQGNGSMMIHAEEGWHVGLWYWSTVWWMLQGLGHPAVLAAVAVVAGGVAFAGVSLERRDRRVGLPALAEIWEWLGSRVEAPQEGFDSPLAAQLWYERKRSLLLLPVVTVFLCVAILLLAASLPSPPMGWGSLWRYLPALAMLLAALPAGLAGMWPRSGYALLRPQAAVDIARARMLVIAETLLSTAALVALLTIAAAALRPALFRLLWDAYLHGEIRLLEMVAVFLAPALLAALGAVVAWPLMGVRRVAAACGVFVLAAVLLQGVLLFLITEGTIAHPGERDLQKYAAYVSLGLLGLALFGMTIERWVRAVQMRIYPTRTFFACAGAWLGIAVFLWLLGPSTGFPVATFLICVVLAGLLVLPVLSIPIEVHRRRVM